jgi:hypothetical protein
MTRSRTGCGRRLVSGLPRRLEIRLATPRARKSFNSRKTCRRLSRSRPHASRTVTRRASKSISTSSRENSLALIDTTVIRHVLLQPRKAGECHLNFAEGCHLYIALTEADRLVLVMEPEKWTLSEAERGKPSWTKCRQSMIARSHRPAANVGRQGGWCRSLPFPT